MKQYSLPLLLLALLLVGASLLPNLIAQTAQAPPVVASGPGAPPQIPPGMPAVPMPPHAGDSWAHGAPRYVPALPSMPSMPGMPGMPGMPAEMPGMGMSPLVAPPLAHVSRPADPRVVELTERYNKLEERVMQLAQEFRQLQSEDETPEVAAGYHGSDRAAVSNQA